jgi:hypothetical protein
MDQLLSMYFLFEVFQQVQKLLKQRIILAISGYFEF